MASCAWAQQSPSAWWGTAQYKIFVVIPLGCTQFKVTLDDMIVAEKIKGAEVGQVLSISDVLLVGGLARTLIGRPTVAGYTVKLLVEEQAKAEKMMNASKSWRMATRSALLSNRLHLVALA